MLCQQAVAEAYRAGTARWTEDPDQVDEVVPPIPALLSVNPHQLGIAVATVDGTVYGAGNYLTPFSVQSISKVLALALALREDGPTLWERVGRVPSAERFDSVSELERRQGMPRNPFVNAGALVVTDLLLSRHGGGAAAIRGLLRQESGNDSIEIDQSVTDSERRSNRRNCAIAHYIASHGIIDNEPEYVLADYVAQCALAASCQDVARTGLFLARDGLGVDGAALVPAGQAGTISALMTTCGTYDSVTDVLMRVGVPVKSGVGGGLLAVVPGRFSVCVWSPALDSHANSRAGMAALEVLAVMLNWTR